MLTTLLVLLSLAAPPSPPTWQTSALYGAEVRSLAVHPRDPDLVFAGTSGGQVYLSRDGGESWSDAGQPLPFTGWVVSALRFDPNVPGRLWAGMWGVWGGGLIAFSDDLGQSWTYRQPPATAGQVYSLASLSGAPPSGGRLLIGTRRGVYASRDEGMTWEYLTRDLPGVEKVTSLLVDRDRPGTIYAGTWRCPYKSEDGGRTWRGIFEGMLLDSEVFSLTPVPGRPDELWASTCGWVYHSLDRGGRWERFKEGMDFRRVPSFAVLPDGRLLAGTVGGLFTSADSGTSWQRATSPDLAVLAIAIDPARPQRILLGTEGSGVWRSADGGATFSRAEKAMTNVRIAALAAIGHEVLAAVNHAGPASGIYSSIDQGRSFQLQRSGLPTVLGLAVAGPKVYAATERGLFERTLDLDWRRVAELPESRIEGLAVQAGRLTARADRVTYGSRGGLWQPLDAKEIGLAPADLGRSVLRTGDANFPELRLRDRTASLASSLGQPALSLELPVPASDVNAAVISQGRLILATSGYGVQIRDLP